MAYTRQDLITLVLENVGVLAAGQSASLEDRAAVDRRIGPKLAELAKREVITGLDANALDDAVFLYVADVVAYACRTPFGITGAKADLLTKAAADAEATLKLMARQYSATAAAAAFDVTRDVLERLGVVAPGQDPSAQDRGVVAARIAPMLADLRARDITAFLTLAEADPAMLPHLADILIARCAPSFGADATTQAALTQAAGLAEGRLNALVRQFDTGVATGGTFDLVQVTLENLGAVAVGRTASAKDRAIVSGRVAAVLDDLRSREVVDLPALDALPPSTLLQLSVVLTAACAMAFGVPAEARAALRAEALIAEAALQRQARQLDAGAGTSGAYDLVQAALERLGVIAAGQTATAKDRAVVTARIAPVLDDLRSREVITIASLAAAQPAMLPALTTIVAAECAPAFALSNEAIARHVALRGPAEAALRAMARQFDDGTATSGTLDVVQAALEVLGAVSAGQTASAKDRAVVSARVAPMLADLRQREVVAFASLGAADPSALIHLSAILAFACAVPFKVPAADLVVLQAGAAEAERALRTIGRQLDGGVATGGVFDPIQAVLENLGVVIAGYTGSAKDRAVVGARVAPTLADLRLREVIELASLAAADPGTQIHLSTILTAACATAFAIPVEARALLDAEAAKAEAALKRIARQLDTGVATSTVYDVAQAALEMLGIVSAGQTASDRDRATVFGHVQPLLMELRGRDICGVTDLSQLSVELQRAFARLLAADCALSFSEVPPARLAMLQGIIDQAERTLRYQSFVYDALPPLRTEPFWARPCRSGWVA